MRLEREKCPKLSVDKARWSCWTTPKSNWCKCCPDPPTPARLAICRPSSIICTRFSSASHQPVLTIHYIQISAINSYQTLLLSSDFWISCAIVLLNQSINQSKYIQLKTPIATKLCYFPVISGFCGSINQSIKIHTIENAKSYHTLLLSSDFWIWCAFESINQAIKSKGFLQFNGFEKHNVFAELVVLGHYFSNPF